MTKAGDDTFISSVVWAEMKKSVSYTVDIHLDKNGVVDEAQCECGAGQGPTAHCKHVAAVLYAAVQFSTTGQVLCEVTCTQVRALALSDIVPKSK